MGPTEIDAGDVASHTLVWMRRLDGRVEQLTAMGLRSEQRLQRLERDFTEWRVRLERDLGELKLDFSAMESRTVQMTAALFKLEDKVASLDERMDRVENAVSLVARAIDDQARRLDQHEGKLNEQGAKLDDLRRAIDAQTGKIDMILQKLA